METILFVLVGCLSGFAAGLLGIGGGLVTVPALAFLLPQLDLPPEQTMHIAIATSLVAIIPTSLLSAYRHHLHNAVVWSKILVWIPGLLLGSLLGVVFISFVEKSLLEILFGGFLFLVACYMLFIAPKMRQLREEEKPLNAYISLPIGFISSIMGVGGGTMTVPYLLWRGFSIQQAVGSSAFCGLPIAFSATLVFFLLQLNGAEENVFVYFPALVGIVVGCIFSVSLGVKFAHRLPVETMKIIFSIMLFFISIKFIAT